MKHYTKYTFKVLFSLLFCNSAIAQNDFFLKEKVSKKIPFTLISNLIVFPIEINGVVLSFVLDTGVSKPILFNLNENDTLKLKHRETFYLYGLGSEGKLEAIKSKYNRIKIGNAYKTNQDIFVVYDEVIDFMPRLGVMIHGIIGYDIFKDFIVEINYNAQFIRLHKSEYFVPKRSRQWDYIPLEIHNKKPYLEALVNIENQQTEVTLLIDTGSSDALWLFEDNLKGIKPSENLFFKDYLGRGLSGSVYGKRSKIKRLKINNFELQQVNVAFPDSLSIDKKKIFKQRHGSLGGNILKRFNLYFDYKNNRLYLKKNSHFKAPFTYNNSGIVLEYNGTRFVKEEIKLSDNNDIFNSNSPSNGSVKINFSVPYHFSLKPVYKIVELRKSSNAYLSGIRIGDVLAGINGKPAYDLSLPQINTMLHGKTGKTIKLKVERHGVVIPFKFKLDSPFYTDKSQH